MKTTTKFLTLIFLLALMLIPASPALAQGSGPDGGRVIFGSNFTLESGEKRVTFRRSGASPCA